MAIITLSNPVFDNSTNDLKYDVTFVPNVHHASPTADFYKKHANATGSPKVLSLPFLMRESWQSSSCGSRGSWTYLSLQPWPANME